MPTTLGYLPAKMMMFSQVVPVGVFSATLQQQSFRRETCHLPKAHMAEAAKKTPVPPKCRFLGEALQHSKQRLVFNRVFVAPVEVKAASTEEVLGPRKMKQNNKLVRALSECGSVSVRAIIATDMVNVAASLQKTSPTATAALGRALMGAVLLADGKKDGETVQLEFRGDGPAGPVIVVGDSSGKVRGYVTRPQADVPLRTVSPPKLDVGSLIGQGELYVIRYHPEDYFEPYRGIVSLKSGEIADDILKYLVESEQTPSALGLGVFVSSRGASVAGGFLVQVLPGATEEALVRLEENVRALPDPTELLMSGVTADDIVDVVLSGLGSQQRQTSGPEFFCKCTAQRVRQAIAMLDVTEIEDMDNKGEELEIHCHFCGQRYTMGPQEIAEVLAERRRSNTAGLKFKHQ